MHRRSRRHASSRLWPNIVTALAKHRQSSGHASSELWPCIVTALDFNGKPDMKVNESEKFTFIMLVA